MPSISVVVPVFNGVQFLPQCVQNIRGQDLAASEIIVVDDGSTDGSADCAEQLGVRVLRQHNQGPASARNSGIAAATGDFIAFLDVDDLWPDDSLAVRYKALTLESSCIAFGLTEWQRWDADSGIWQTFDLSSKLYFISSILYRRTAFERFGLFDESMRFGEDVDWSLRALDGGIHLAIVDRVVHYYRLHGSNMTLKDPKKSGEYLFIAMRRSILRKRAAGRGA